MAKYTYPAIFEKEHEGGYSIYFPDIEGCCTQAEDIAEGIENAGDALCLMLYELENKKNPYRKQQI
jgi:predicted RNase H-like HicB family nuclease